MNAYGDIVACVPVKTQLYLAHYLEHINILNYEENPNYQLLKQFFMKSLH